MKRTFAAVAAAAVVVAVLAAPVRADHGPCSTGQPGAEVLQPGSGQFTVNGPLGSVTLPTGAPAPGVVISTTGTVDVVVEYDCLIFLSMTVVKDPGGAEVVVHNKGWDNLQCLHGTKTEPVTIGLDAGNYEVRLNWATCDGRRGGRNGDGTIIVDPPLPLTKLA